MDAISILISLGIGIICAAVGAWIGYRFAMAKHEKEAKIELIRDVAEKYRHLRETNKTSGLDGLIRSGVARLSSNDEVEEAIKIITSFGNKDPLGSTRHKLVGKDIHHFFKVIQKNNLNIWQNSDLEKAILGAKDL
jgi:hypothetical protein